VSATGGAIRTGARLRLAITASAVLLASLCFREGYPTPIYDSLGYYILSIVLRIQGLSAWPTDLRTYGYPLFVAIVTGFRDLPPEEVRLATFVAQLVVFLAVCHCVSRKLAAIFRSETLGVWAYGVGALNPVLLIHTTELLSDLVSAVLVQLCVALSWKVPEEDAAGGGVNRRVFLSFLCAGAAVAVRPANAVVVVQTGVVTCPWAPASSFAPWHQTLVQAPLVALNSGAGPTPATATREKLTSGLPFRCGVPGSFTRLGTT
jgi:hypothetical protein